jgi:flagellar biosynthesis/type III secretory pathway M-ring protein FliF/YscJ
MRFDDSQTSVPPTEAATLFGLGLRQSDLIHIGQTGFIGLVALIIGLFVFRPIIAQLSSSQAASSGRIAMAGPSAMLDRGPSPADGDGRLLLAAPGSSTHPTARDVRPDGRTMTQAEISQSRTMSTRRLADMVEQYPDESLTLLRAWLAEGAS